MTMNNMMHDTCVCYIFRNLGGEVEWEEVASSAVAGVPLACAALQRHWMLMSGREKPT